MMWRWLAAAACAALLFGCASLTPPSEAPAARPVRSAINQFKLSGRLAVRNGAESFSGRIDWRHGDDGSERILLSSPLGQGLAELDADRQGARLHTSDNKRYAGPSLDDLSEQVFGARLPLSSLPRWVLGDAPGDGKRLALDSLGRPASFWMAGWRVAYLSYESEMANALPSLIRLSRDELDVRLKIDRWELAP